MKVEQARRVIEAAAAMHAKSGNGELASALVDLASILRCYDKREVQEFVHQVAKLRDNR